MQKRHIASLWAPVWFGYNSFALLEKNKLTRGGILVQNSPLRILKKHSVCNANSILVVNLFCGIFLESENIQKIVPRKYSEKYTVCLQMLVTFLGLFFT